MKGHLYQSRLYRVAPLTQEGIVKQLYLKTIIIVSVFRYV